MLAMCQTHWTEQDEHCPTGQGATSFVSRDSYNHQDSVKSESCARLKKAPSQQWNWRRNK